LQGWDLPRSARFATAAASLKVTRPGLEMFSLDQIQAFADQVQVEVTTRDK